VRGHGRAAQQGDEADGRALARVPRGRSLSPVLCGQEGSVESVTGPSGSGLYHVTLRPCTAHILATLLPGSASTVWLRGYRPEPTVRWWAAPMRLSPEGTPVPATVRDVEFDLQLSVERFLELLPEFEDNGLDLYVMAQPVPDTLTLRGLADGEAQRVLLANGLVAHFDLPHAHEVAVLSSPSRELLQNWLKGPLRGRVQGSGDAA